MIYSNKYLSTVTGKPKDNNRKKFFPAYITNIILFTFLNNLLILFVWFSFMFSISILACVACWYLISVLVSCLYSYIIIWPKLKEFFGVFKSNNLVVYHKILRTYILDTVRFIKFQCTALPYSFYPNRKLFRMVYFYREHIFIIQLLRFDLKKGKIPINF